MDRALLVHQNVIARSNLNNSQKQKAMFALGQDFFAAGMLDRAESVFLELMESNSKSISKATICESLRTIYEQTQEWQKAIEATKCSRKNTNNDLSNSGINMDSLISHYYCQLADESLQKGNLHEVDGFIAKAAKAYKNSTRLMSLQGDIAFHQKQYTDSFNYYLNAIKTDSRLLSMLFESLDDSASNAGKTEYLQKEMIKIYEDKQDNNIFEAILRLADKYGSNEEVDALVNSVLNKQKLSIKSIYKASSYLKDRHALASKSNSSIVDVHQSLENHLQGVPSFICEHCGYKMHDYLWRCPACNLWDTIDQT